MSYSSSDSSRNSFDYSAATATKLHRPFSRLSGRILICPAMEELEKYAAKNPSHSANLNKSIILQPPLQTLILAIHCPDCLLSTSLLLKSFGILCLVMIYSESYYLLSRLLVCFTTNCLLLNDTMLR